MPAPIDFPSMDATEETGPRGYNSDWLTRRLIVQFVLEAYLENAAKSSNSRSITRTAIIKKAERMIEWGRRLMREDELQWLVGAHLQQLSRLGILKQNGHNEYLLVKDPRVVATWGEDVTFIHQDLKDAVVRGKGTIRSRLERYGKAAGLQPLYSVEMNYPVLRAIALMDTQEQEAILEAIREFHVKGPLSDAILLTFGKGEDRKNWLESQAPHLIGKRIYEATAEHSILAGGLGRVEQYHSKEMARLTGKEGVVNVVEPFYPQMPDPRSPGRLKKTDLRTVSNPIKLDRESTSLERNPPIKLEFMGETHFVQMVQGVNQSGVRVLLLRDVLDWQDRRSWRNYPMIDQLYHYDPDSQTAPSHLEFSAFFSKAYWRWVVQQERALKKEQGEKWSPPMINANDAQAALVSVWRLMDYYDAKDRGDEEEARFLESFFISVTTHTYRNRGFLGRYNEGMKNWLVKIGIPEEFHWLFQSVAAPQEVAGWGEMDITLAGLRAANVRKAVSALHANEVSRHDPGSPLYGLANGVDRESATKYLRAYLNADFLNEQKHREILEKIKRNPARLAAIVKRINNGDSAISLEEYDRIVEEEPDRIIQAKQTAKEILGILYPEYQLNPDQLLITYSGRWVEEKRGRRAFDPDSIEKLIKKGAAVILFGNSYSQGDLERMSRIMEDVNQKGPGRFVFKGGFTLEEQLQLLAATDVQVQDSDRATGAAEFTESPATASGGLSMGPAPHEGVIQKHGVPMNYHQAGWGNSIVPVEAQPSAYLEALFRVIEMPRSSLHQYQINSIRLSRILDAVNTAAAYLRLFNKEYAKHRRNVQQEIPALPERWWFGSPGPLIRSVTVNEVVQHHLDQQGQMMSLDDQSVRVSPGTKLRIQVKVQQNKRSPRDIHVILRAPDGNIYPLTPQLDRMEPDIGKENIIPFTAFLPDSVIGECILSISDGISRQQWPYTVIFAEEIPIIQYQVNRQQEKRTVVRIRFPRGFGGSPKDGAAILFGFHTEGAVTEPWKFDPTPEEETLYGGTEDWTPVEKVDSGVFRAPLTFLGEEGEGWEVELLVRAKKISALTFVVEERTSEGTVITHDRHLTNFFVDLKQGPYRRPPYLGMADVDEEDENLLESL
ncbi:MAG: glycogen/starch synthase [Candidatus Omnitrophica bacterium]|nr:glycogen/starch synthase [Candidatus Omnitrophota bacterium]